MKIFPLTFRNKRAHENEGNLTQATTTTTTTITH